MPDSPDPELLGRYLANECSEAETAAVRRYLMAHPEAALALERYLERLDGIPQRERAPDSAASWGAVRSRIRASEVAETRDALPGAPTRPDRVERRSSTSSRPLSVLHFTPRVPWWRRRATAAGLCAGAAVVALAVHQSERRPTSTPLPPPRIYATAERQRADLELGDGTRVRIAPASRLRVAADFGSERRDVYLEGEAYFDVVHDTLRPFTVYAGNASAHDLGTGFSVRSYAGEGAVQVIVREGAVALSGVGRLGAGDVGRLTLEGRASVRRNVDVEAMLGWLDGRLAYEDAPLGQVLQDLRRWYGVDARLADTALATLPFTGTLAGLRSAAAIDLVAATLGLRARRAGGHLLLHAIAGQTPRDRHRRTVIEP